MKKGTKKENVIFHKYKIDILDGKNHKRIIFYYADILYIIYNHPYCDIFCCDGAKYMVKSSLQQLESRFPLIFFRCSRSVLVNVARIKEYGLTYITAENNYKITLSDKKKSNFSQKIDSIYKLTGPFEQCFKCHSVSDCCTMFEAKPEKKI